jgi:23S rRNA (uracil1939-C5)-methyltransferase
VARRKGPGKRPKGGQSVELDVVALDPSGDGIAEWPDGSEVHVPGALPGERIQALIGHSNRQRARAYGQIERLLDRSPSRRRPPCEHQGRCEGCPLMIADEPAQRRFKRAMLRDAYRLDVDRVVHDASCELGYRWSSKRVAGGKPGAVILGSYRRRTHVIARMGQCLVDHPAIAECARQLERLASDLGVEPYDEQSKTGLLRYVWFKTDGEGRVLACLVFAESDAAQAAALAEGLDSAAGVSWCTQKSTGNALRGDQVQQLRGTPTLTVGMGAEQATVGALGFLQPNPPLATLAQQDVIARPDGRALAGRRALDLFAGAGATTELLKAHFESVIPAETYPESAEQLGIEPESAEQVVGRLLAGSAEDRAVDMVVADPPRAGLGAELCGQLTALGAPHLNLMSCSAASLRRDLDRLLAADGRYRLMGLRGYDTLPQTAHVELVAWLQRRR